MIVCVCKCVCVCVCVSVCVCVCVSVCVYFVHTIVQRVVLTVVNALYKSPLLLSLLLITLPRVSAIAGSPQVHNVPATSRTVFSQRMNGRAAGSGYWFRIARLVKRRARDRRVASSNPGRNGGRIFFSRVNFLCRLCVGVRSTHVSPQ